MAIKRGAISLNWPVTTIAAIDERESCKPIAKEPPQQVASLLPSREYAVSVALQSKLLSTLPTTIEVAEWDIAKLLSCNVTGVPSYGIVMQDIPCKHSPAYMNIMLGT